MPVGFGKHAINSKGRTLSVPAQFKRRILEVAAAENCLAHSIIKPIAKADNDPNYEYYRLGNNIRLVERNLLVTTGIDSSGGEGHLNSLDSKNIFGTIR
jgi:hypothetical protein